MVFGKRERKKNLVGGPSLETTPALEDRPDAMEKVAPHFLTFSPELLSPSLTLSSPSRLPSGQSCLIILPATPLVPGAVVTFLF